MMNDCNRLEADIMSNRVIRVTGKGQIKAHPDMTRIFIRSLDLVSL